MVDRSVHLAVRGLVAGPGGGAPAVGREAAAPGARARLGGYEISFEAARPRILPGEENELALRWKAAEEGAAAVEMQVVLDLPAEVKAPEAGRSAKAVMGAGEGEVRFRVTGEEPGGVWVDALLTVEDEGGAVLARARAGFAVARHRVVISDVEVAPSVVAAGGACVVKAKYAWTGASRVRGTIGGRLRRRADGAELELHREKISALGERVQEWQVKAPVDLEVADFDVEMTFEGKEGGERAQFGKTGVLAVRRARDAEVLKVAAARSRWGAGEEVEVRVQVRNTGVGALEGEAGVEVLARAAGAPEAEAVEGAASPERAALRVEPEATAEAVFVAAVPQGLEGKRLEARGWARFGSLQVEKREAVGVVVVDHLLEFDGFAADRYAYGGGDEASVECRVRDDGARPGGAFDVVLKLMDEGREVARGGKRVELKGAAAAVKAVLKLPADLATKGALDLEVAVPEVGAARRVPGFLRVRQAVASRVVIMKPPAAVGEAAFLFEGEAVDEEVALGEVEGAGACRWVKLDSGAAFVGGPAFEPVVGERPALERAVSKALVRLAGAPPGQANGKAWKAVMEAASAREDGPVPGGVSLAPLAIEIGVGKTFEEMAALAQAKGEGKAGAALATVLRLTGAALGGRRLPSAELAGEWMAAAEAGARAAGGRAKRAEALKAARAKEAEGLEALREVGLDARGARGLAEAAVLRRAIEVEVLARAVQDGASDRLLSITAAMAAAEERLREVIRFYTRFTAKMAEGADAAAREGEGRRKLAALRQAQVAVKGADAIVPGGYNRVEVEVALPEASPAGGPVQAAVGLPSELWIVTTEGAERTRGQYLMRAVEVKPGGKAAWALELYVPERAGGEPGAIEVRVGFAEGGEREGGGLT